MKSVKTTQAFCKLALTSRESQPPEGTSGSHKALSKQDLKAVGVKVRTGVK